MEGITNNKRLKLIEMKVTEKSLFLFAAAIRLFFIAFGVWQDGHMEVKYTDVDYRVFSDAAELLLRGKSPFERETYRYSPLLAFTLVPNTLLHPVWGKILFSIADLLAGHLIHQILVLQGIDRSMSIKCSALWLFNPFTFTIATRGNCEAIVCCVILRILFCLLRGSIIEAAIWYGFVVHFRIYPIIYVVAILIILDKNYSRYSCLNEDEDGEIMEGTTTKESQVSKISCFLNFLNKNRVTFGAVSGGVFLLFTGICYLLYGNEFLYEALLYHVSRTDHRHNFSIYFYHIYLRHNFKLSLLEKIISFLPQFLVQSLLTVYCGKDITFCFLVQTLAFVAFNKVITAQYFVWFFCLFPLIIPWSKMKLRNGVLCTVLWVTAQVHWLIWAYALEFQGKNVFLGLWFASIIFFAANIFILSMLIWYHTYTPYEMNYKNLWRKNLIDVTKKQH